MPYPANSTTTFNAYYLEQELNETDLGQANSFSEVWIVEKKVVPPANPLTGTLVEFTEDDLRLATVEGAVPPVGMRYVDWYGLSAKLWMQYATLVSRTLTNIENGRVRVTLRWLAPFHVSAKWWATNPGPSSTPPIAYDLTLDYSTSYRGTELFRGGWTVNQPATADTSAEIGGTIIIPGNVGQPYNIPQLRMKLRRVVDFKYIPMSQLMKILSGYQDSLNDTAFMAGTVVLDNPAGSGTISVALAGFPRGSVLCESVNLVKTEGQYGELLAEFVHEDEYFFHDQIPDRETDGTPKLVTPVGPAAVPELASVKWRRVPRPYKEHNAFFFDQSAYTGAAWTPVSNSGYLKLAQQGYWGDL
jgi:hypothetical protein